MESVAIKNPTQCRSDPRQRQSSESRRRRRIAQDAKRAKRLAVALKLILDDEPPLIDLSKPAGLSHGDECIAAGKALGIRSVGTQRGSPAGLRYPTAIRPDRTLRRCPTRHADHRGGAA